MFFIKLYILHVYKSWAPTLWDTLSCHIVKEELYLLHCALLIYHCNFIFNFLLICFLVNWCMCMDLWLFAHPYKLALVCGFAHAYTFAFELKTIVHCFASKFLVLFLVYSFPMWWSATTHNAISLFRMRYN